MLADLAFVMQDYDQALQCYKLVAQDYKLEKMARLVNTIAAARHPPTAQTLTPRASRHNAQVAGAEEMIGLCLALTDGSRTEMEKSFESATQTLARGADKDARRCARCVMWTVDAYRAVPQKMRVRSQCLALLSSSLALSCFAAPLSVLGRRRRARRAYCCERPRRRLVSAELCTTSRRPMCTSS
jgi:hypothetical protein